VYFIYIYIYIYIYRGGFATINLAISAFSAHRERKHKPSLRRDLERATQRNLNSQMKRHWPGIISGTDRPENQFVSNSADQQSELLTGLCTIPTYLYPRTERATLASVPTHFFELVELPRQVRRLRQAASTSSDYRVPTADLDHPSGGQPRRATGHHTQPPGRLYAPGGYGGSNTGRERILADGLQLNGTKRRKPSHQRHRPIRVPRTPRALPRRGSQLHGLSRTRQGRRSTGQR